MEYIADPAPQSLVKETAIVAKAVASAAPLTSIPALHSNASATAKLYLDFDGAAAQTWGSYSVPATPAYDQDGVPTSFSDTELASINTIWARVAEAYSPFNVDVTTVNTGNLTNKVTMAMVIGGNGAWTGGQYGGMTYVGGFYNTASNIGWVFSKNLNSADPKFTADASAHEAGHGFGLAHQSSYDANGNLVAVYNPGDSLRAPIMGSAFYSARGLWWNGPTEAGATVIQDDLAKLTGGSNGWSYRADDHGNTQSAADPLTVSGTSISGSGIITQTTDKDFFSFTTAAGSVSLAGQVPTGAMLDLRLDLYNSTGTLVTSADTSTLGETITANLAAGTYRLGVSSHGGYGDIGQYTVSGTTASAATVTAPSNLAATSSTTSTVNLTWRDNSSNETGFRVERSTDGGTTWSTLASLAAGSTSYANTGLTAGTTYAYRVFAVAGTTSSAASNAATVTTIPAAPATASATAVSSSQINVSWSDVAGETSYAVQRSANGVDGWTQVGTAAANATTFQNTGLSAGVKYYYRVLAVNASGSSAASPVASATTLTSAAPNAPSNLRATTIAKTSAKLAWTDNATNETGFKIERSTNGTTWTQVGTVGANVVTYSASGLKAKTSYWFRVLAYNASGNSAYSNALSLRTSAASPGAASLAPGLAIDLSDALYFALATEVESSDTDRDPSLAAYDAVYSSIDQNGDIL